MRINLPLSEDPLLQYSLPQELLNDNACLVNKVLDYCTVVDVIKIFLVNVVKLVETLVLLPRPPAISTSKNMGLGTVSMC